MAESCERSVIDTVIRSGKNVATISNRSSHIDVLPKNLPTHVGTLADGALEAC